MFRHPLGKHSEQNTCSFKITRKTGNEVIPRNSNLHISATKMTHLDKNLYVSKHLVLFLKHAGDFDGCDSFFNALTFLLGIKTSLRFTFVMSVLFSLILCSLR